MAKIKIIVNPLAGHGYAAQIAPDIARHLTALGADYDMVHTRSAGEAIVLAQEALASGFDTLVAVGGDGTSHEVINGMMERANGSVAGTLGCIPAGSGNDFATMVGAPKGVQAACTMIVEGNTRIVDIGRVTIDDKITRYFDNNVGIGLDGLVARGTRKLKHLRGLALYLPVVLKTILVDIHPPLTTIAIDDETMQTTTTMTVITNGRREGGGFLIAPDAKCDDGLLDLMIAGTMTKLEMLAMIPRFLKGTHTTHPAVSMRTARHVVVSSPDPLYLHVDGEILSDIAHHVEINIIPGALRMIAPRP